MKALRHVIHYQGEPIHVLGFELVESRPYVVMTTRPTAFVQPSYVSQVERTPTTVTLGYAGTTYKTFHKD
jgi:hypothetical protein